MMAREEKEYENESRRDARRSERMLILRRREEKSEANDHIDGVVLLLLCFVLCCSVFLVFVFVPSFLLSLLTLLNEKTPTSAFLPSASSGTSPIISCD